MINLPLPVLGSYFKWIDQSAIVPAGGAQILPPNANRWAIVFQNIVAASTMAVSFLPNFGPEGGISVLPTTLPLLMDFSHWGGIVQDAWYWSSNPNGVFQLCWEIAYMPPAMSEAGVDTEE